MRRSIMVTSTFLPLLLAGMVLTANADPPPLRPITHRRQRTVVAVEGRGPLLVKRGRTYVMGYQVIDGMAVPIIGEITDEFTLGAPVAPDYDRPYEPPPVDTRRNREVLDDFFSKPQAQDWLEKDKPATTEPVKPPEGVSFGLVRLTGRLEPAENDRLHLVVERSGKRIAYDIGTNDYASKLLADSPDRRVRAVLTGYVSPGSPTPVMRVDSGYFEME